MEDQVIPESYKCDGKKSCGETGKRLVLLVLSFGPEHIMKEEREEDRMEN
jgi:hypothetical protein